MVVALAEETEPHLGVREDQVVALLERPLQERMEIRHQQHQVKEIMAEMVRERRIMPLLVVVGHLLLVVMQSLLPLAQAAQGLHQLFLDHL